MNETLKGVAHIGAELAAAKADLQREMERHRKTWRQLEQVTGLLQRILNTPRGTSGRIIIETDEEAEIRAALSQQAEPAPAQDELRKRFDEIEFEVAQGKHSAASVFTQMRTAAMYIRPAQTEQQPEQSGLVGKVCGGDGTHNTVNVAVVGPVPWGDLRIGTPVRLIPAPATPSPAMDAKEE